MGRCPVSGWPFFEVQFGQIRALPKNTTTVRGAGMNAASAAEPGLTLAHPPHSIQAGP